MKKSNLIIPIRLRLMDLGRDYDIPLRRKSMAVLREMLCELNKELREQRDVEV